jgi:hypothetical protein
MRAELGLIRSGTPAAAEAPEAAAMSAVIVPPARDAALAGHVVVSPPWEKEEADVAAIAMAVANFLPDRIVRNMLATIMRR